MAQTHEADNGTRVIFHVDVNSAFLSWSALERLREDPDALDLRTVPSAVGGDVKTRHGVITARSIPAKKFGVQTGEPVMRALQKCPNLILVPSDFTWYRTCSSQFMDILRSTGAAVEQASIDEAYLDVTDLVAGPAGVKAAEAVGPAGTAATASSAGSGLTVGPAVPDSAVRERALALAARIRERVRGELGFTVNVGMSVNRLLAKMASDFEKPDRTHTLWPEEVPAKMWPLPIRDLYGCGSRTAERLNSYGIATIGQAAATDPAILRSLLGENAGSYIARSSRGHSSDRVRTQSEEARSYSNELTTSEDIGPENYEAAALPLLRHLTDRVSARMKRDGVCGRTVSVSVKTDAFRRRSRQTGLPESTNDPAVLYREAEHLLRALLWGEEAARADDTGAGEARYISGAPGAGGSIRAAQYPAPAPGSLFGEGARIRLIGAGMSNLDHGTYHQIGLEEYLQDRKEQERQAEEKKQEEERLSLQKKQEEERLSLQKKQEEERLAQLRQQEAEKQRARARRAAALEAMMASVQKKYGTGALRRGQEPTDATKSDAG